MPVTQNTYLVDTWATNYVLGYGSNTPGTIADRVFTPIPVDVSAGKFKKIDKGSWFISNVEERPLGGENKQAQFALSDGTFVTREYGLKHRIDDRVASNNRTALDIARTASTFLANQHQIHKDGVFASKFMTTGIWGTDVVGAASPSGAQFLQLDQSGSKPIQLVRKYRRAVAKATGKRPNVLVLGTDVYDTLLDHADMTGRMSVNSLRMVNEQLLAQLFEVDEVVVAEAIYNSAAEGITPVMSYIVNSKSMLLVYRAPVATTDGTAVTAGAIFPWRSLIPGTNEDGLAILSRRVEPAFSQEWDSRAAWGMELMASDLGVYFSTVVA